MYTKSKLNHSVEYSYVLYFQVRLFSFGSVTKRYICFKMTSFLCAMCEQSLRDIELQFARLKFILILPCKPFCGSIFGANELEGNKTGYWKHMGLSEHKSCDLHVSGRTVGGGGGTGILLHQLRLLQAKLCYLNIINFTDSKLFRNNFSNAKID